MSGAIVERLFDLALWLAGAGHFVILIASAQVPSRLGWKEDLKQLMPFNRKLLWVQGGFTALTIIAFGTLTLALYQELLRGDRAALGLAAFIGLYLDGAHFGGCFLLLARGLAEGEGVCDWARAADGLVFFFSGELSRPLRVESVWKRVDVSTLRATRCEQTAAIMS